MIAQRRKWSFLVDANLPPRLCHFFQTNGYDASHIKDLAMEGAPDIEIWNTANLRQAVIVTKDKDFASLAMSGHDVCPVVLVRIGNVRHAALITLFERALPDLVRALRNGDKLIELL